MNSLNKNNKWIFLVPIDGSTNKAISQNQNEISKIEQSSKILINNEREEHLEEDLKKNINVKDNNINIEKQNDFKIFSKSKNLSVADSSKIYMSEFLKKNWKIKIKRLIIKLNKRYTKKAENLFYEEPKNCIINNSEEKEIFKNNILINIFNDSQIFNNNLNNNIPASGNNIYNSFSYNYNINNAYFSKEQGKNDNFYSPNKNEKIKNQ